MIQNVTTEDFTVEAFGEVTGPPEVQSILDRVRIAAAAKSELTLTAAECRVLHDFLGGC
jgi:hypothetical protein